MENIKDIARELRADIINMIHRAKSGHPGGSLSIIDVLTYLYFERKTENDKLVLSKGHAAPALYAVLAKKGYIDYEELKHLRKINSMLQGHPNMKSTKGVDMSTGSLGQGMSAAVGMAIAKKLDKVDDKVFVILGDGELNEGIVWEAFMSAAHYKLNNLIIIIDNNKLQIDGKNSDVMSVYPIDEKLKGFMLNVIKCDGHNIDEIRKSFDEAYKSVDKPTAIILDTIKGKGVSFMADDPNWHGKAPNEEEAKKALEELGGKLWD